MHFKENIFFNICSNTYKLHESIYTSDLKPANMFALRLNILFRKCYQYAGYVKFLDIQ